MAENVVQYLQSPRGQGKKFVVLAGAGHIHYGFGIPKRVLRRMALPYYLILPHEVSIPTAEEGQGMEYESPDIPLLPADFFWMVTYDRLKSDPVRLGVQVSDSEGTVKVVEVSPGSPAEQAGVKAGDTILMLDGQKIAESHDLVHYLGRKNFGDTATLTLQRGGAEIRAEVTFTKPSL